jgi:NAD(P)-dependent dehydrogenase (short-subunit alcohol dehydrogenase family)
MPAGSDTAATPTGRVALVTGGGRGLGAEVVRRFAALGHAVAIHCHGSLREARGLAEAIVARGIPALAVTADLRDEGAVRAMVHRVTDHFGRIDALVATAGRRRATVLEETTADDLRHHLAVGCVGGFVVAQEAAAVMIRQDSGGGIVLVADAAAPVAGHVAAVTAAAAVTGLARALATDLALRNDRVRVNCLAAGQATAAEVAFAAVRLATEGMGSGATVPVGSAAGFP